MMKNIPRLIFWELTKKCNLECKHCRAEAEFKEYNELTFEHIKSIIDDIANEYKPILVLTGGEPLYRNDIYDIAAYGSSKGLQIALATNGTLIDSSIAKKIKDSGVKRVSISIDGSSAKAHDSFRGIPGSFDDALKGIEYLKNEEIEFQLNATITKNNVDEIEDIMKLSEKMGAMALHIFMLVPVGCGVEIAESDMISKDKYEEVLNWFYDASKETTMEMKATCAPHYYRILRQRAKEEGRTVTFESDGMSAVTRGCLAGSGVCFISHKGDVQPCGYFPKVVGNVLEKPFKEIWENSNLFVELRDLSNLKGKCGLCEYRAFCAGCRARALYETEDYMEEEPYCVYVPKKVKT